ncbi:unnamed protein product [Rotaria sordida]|uniref:Uncharacterized protein n=1 Tax=Rotaria sordida TaxID=392033 RepID=A0A813S7T5_9BILA|nr:unnamed protein product [Rotaria sordida]CAF0789926.1 unnamed protein product [Rotaria sordida]CAF0791343.1 unnamed protein product [Rotaria sordida]CAF0942143.1 unnamed protein product [Rotaria sordida]CAF4024794.1 unnamed protein product [Rotaria sordida]
MAAYHIPDPSNRLTNEQMSHTLNKIDENDVSQPSSSSTSEPPRKRSNSVLQWMQKTLHITKTGANHDDSRSRQRSSSITHHDKTTRSPPVSFPAKKHGRPRSSTLDSTGSTDKKMPPRKKTITDTDEKAEQTRSIFEFAFFH